MTLISRTILLPPYVGSGDIIFDRYDSDVRRGGMGGTMCRQVGVNLSLITVDAWMPSISHVDSGRSTSPRIVLAGARTPPPGNTQAHGAFTTPGKTGRCVRRQFHGGVVASLHLSTRGCGAERAWHAATT